MKPTLHQAALLVPTRARGWVLPITDLSGAASQGLTTSRKKLEAGSGQELVL